MAMAQQSNSLAQAMLNAHKYTFDLFKSPTINTTQTQWTF